jgi:dTDP-4-amino-4,6-dideoxygalactose transaminase
MEIQMIHFNKPPTIGTELKYIQQAIEVEQKISGDGLFTKKCSQWFEKEFQCNKTLLTTSCTHALEMTAILLDIKDGDEIIMPSYTFVSTANAFVLRGAKIVFVDIRPDTMNIDENKIEQAITSKTKVIVPVHYAGVACEMDTIMLLAKEYNLYVVEDAAQAMMSTYKGKALGTIGDFGCFSFHETKNYSMGEGGALLINNTKFIDNAEIIREKGTNRSKFIKGQVDKYTWVDKGSSYLPSELNAAFLHAQLEKANEINNNRLSTWNIYYKELKELEEKQYIELPYIPENLEHNAHMFYIKLKDIDTRSNLIKYLKQNDILSVFHYIPLHSSPAGIKYSVFNANDIYTTVESERLLRLPIYYNIEKDDQSKVIKNIKDFFNEN